MNTRDLYCKLSSNALEISFSKVEYSSQGNFKAITCQMNKLVLNNSLQFVDIELHMNLGNNSFTLSSNNQTYLFSQPLLSWKTRRMINPTNLNILLDFIIPARPDLQYKLEMIADIENATKNEVSCVFPQGSFPNCNLDTNYFDNLEYLPLKLNFTYHIIHNFSKFDQTLNIDYLVYYKPIQIEHLKPFVISSLERKFHPARIIFNINRFKLNSNFKLNSKFKCNGKFHLFNYIQSLLVL
jgi:hypothetical protein